VKLNVFASRHSAFYSPLIASITAGFLAEEGIEATYRVLAPGERSQDLIREGKADIIQSAVSSNWKPMEAGNSPLPVHFAQINQRDGFFLAARDEDPRFEWKKLEGRILSVDHGGQPLAMLKYAVQHNGADWSRIKVIDRGAPERMMEAFRAGEGGYVHLQGPGPEILADEGCSKSAISVGASMPAVAFSSLCCSRDFVGTGGYQAFRRGYAKAREWVRAANPAEVAAKEIVLFPNLKAEVLADSVARYQALGNWDGAIAIDRKLYEQALNVFESSQQVKERHPYDAVCVT
jgi:NitT/TauT family transport system substrate-binding protein